MCFVCTCCMLHDTHATHPHHRRGALCIPRAAGSKFSIELCGGTHVPSASLMDQFSLVEESAVAKGVRRVVGVTGRLAVEAKATGEALQATMAALSAVDLAAADASAIDANKKGMTSLKLKNDAAVTSTHIKAEIREALQAREKLLAKRLKELASGATDKLAAEAIVEASAAASAGEKYFVLELGEGIDGKAMQPIVKQVRDLPSTSPRPPLDLPSISPRSPLDLPSISLDLPSISL